MIHRNRSPATARDGLSPGRVWLAIGLIAAAALAAYHNSYRSPLFFDDARCIGENASIRQLWPLTTVLSPPPSSMLGSRPLANLSFALNYATGGFDVAGYHAVNLALHLAAALGLFGVVRRTLARPVVGGPAGADPARAGAIALFAAAAWAAHPLLVAAVGYIAQRTEVLMGLCYVFTLYGFIRGAETGRRGWLAFSAIACALGMMAKEVMVTAPLVVLLHDRFFFAGTLRAALRQRRTYYAALAATWLLLFWLMRRGLDPSVAEGGGASPWDYALVQCRALAVYATRAVWPHPLAFDYGEIAPAGLGAALPYLWAPVLLIGGVVVGFVARRPAGFWCAWIALALAPTSSFVPIALQPIAENRTYLPLAGALALLAAGLWRVAGRRAVPIAALAGLALIVLAVRRNAGFRDPATPWAEALWVNPANARAHSNLAVALQGAGRAAEAETHYRRGIELKPTSAELHSSYASLLQQQGRTGEAITHGAEAVRLAPGFAQARSNLAGTLLGAGRTEEGIAQLQAALQIDPSLVTAHHNLALALTYSGRPAEALEHFAAAFRARPGDALFRQQYGNALLATGRHAAALEAYQSSLALRPDQPEVHLRIGVVHFKEGRWPEAAGAFQAALAMKPDYTDARHNLALAWEQMGRPAEAIRELEAALRAQPDHMASRATLDRLRGAAK